jgi:hypothetical protein
MPMVYFLIVNSFLLVRPDPDSFLPISDLDKEKEIIHCFVILFPFRVPALDCPNPFPKDNVVWIESQ